MATQSSEGSARWQRRAEKEAADGNEGRCVMTRNPSETNLPAGEKWRGKHGRNQAREQPFTRLFEQFRPVLVHHGFLHVAHHHLIGSSVKFMENQGVSFLHVAHHDSPPKKNAHAKVGELDDELKPSKE